MCKKTDVQLPGHGYLLPSLQYPLYTHVTPTYLWNVLREASVCSECKHLNAGSDEQRQDRWNETGQWSLA